MNKASQTTTEETLFATWCTSFEPFEQTTNKFSLFTYLESENFTVIKKLDSLKQS